MHTLQSCLALMVIVVSPLALLGQGSCRDCPQTNPAVPPGPLPPPVVTLQVIAPCQAKADGEIPYEITVENRGSAPAHFVTVKNSLPANAKLVRTEPVATQDGNEIHWNLGTLAPGQRKCMTMVLNASGPGEVENCVRVSYEHGVCTKTKVGGTAPGQEEKMPPPAPLKAPKLDIAGEVPPRQPTNTGFSAKFNIGNPGDGIARNVTVIARLPANVAYESTPQGGAFFAESKEVRWQLGDIDPKGQKTIELKLKGQGLGNATLRVNALADGNVTVEKDFTIELFGGVGLHMEVRDKPDPLFVGEETEYDILVRNTGNIPATRLSLSAAAPVEMHMNRPRGPSDYVNWRDGDPTVTFNPFNLQPGQEAMFHISAKALKPGFVKFRAQLTGDQLPSGPVLREEPTTIVNETPSGGLITSLKPRVRAANWQQWWTTLGTLVSR